MKTERRHKLETNELADSLSHWIDSVKPYLRTIAGLLIAVAVLAFVYAIISRQSAAKARAGWDDYYAAMETVNREKLDDVADKFPGTPVAWWSTMVLADIDLDEGTNLLFSDKPAGLEKLHSALERYEDVRKQAGEPTILQRATFGVARANESLGKLKEASEAYLSLSAKWPTCALAPVARLRADDLERQNTKQFYDWFDKQNPGKALAKEPGTPGEKPAFDIGTIDLPPAKSGQSTGILPDGPLLPGGAQSETPKDDLPADESAAPETGGPEAGGPETTSPDKSAPEESLP